MINVNQITSQLAKMPDPMLQKFAEMHKNDPYTVSLALSESNRRKQLRSGVQAKLAGQEMPKVVDQEIGGIAPQAMPQQMPQQLPEEVGIGTLPAQNLQKMAGGGIVAFDEGGEVPRFQNRGEVQDPFRNASRELTELILATAAKYNIDPTVAMRLVKQESGFDPNAQSKAGAVGLTQLKEAAAKDMGLTPEERFDPVKNVNAGFGYLRKQLDKYGNDYSKALSAYNWGGGNVDKHLTKNEGQINKIGLPKETADYLTKILPMGAAGAGELPRKPKLAEGEQLSPDGKTVLDARGIPLRSATAAVGASPEPKDTRTYFGKLADTMGVPESVQRNVSNTLNALGGWSSPVTTIGRGVGAASKALEPTAEMIQKAEQLKGIASTPRLTPPVPGGIAALDEAAQATRAAAEASRRARALEADVAAAKGAEQSVEAATKSAQTAANLEKAIAAGPREAALTSAKVANTGRALSMDRALDMAGTEEAPSAAAATTETPDGVKVTPDKPEGGIETLVKPDKTMDAKGGDKYKDEMALQFFLGLMGGQSPNMFTNVSQAGLGALKYGQEAKKEESERAYREALSKHYGKDPFLQRLEALKDPENRKMFQQMKELEREPMTREKLYTAFMSSPTALGLMADPDKLSTAFQNYVKMYEQNLGPIGGLPSGVRVTKG